MRWTISNASLPGGAVATAVLLLADLVLDEAGLLQIDLVNELQATAFANCPDSTAWCREGSNDLVEHLVVELGRRNFATRQLRDFLHQALDLALGAFDLFGIHRGGSAGRGSLGVFGSAHE